MTATMVSDWADIIQEEQTKKADQPDRLPALPPGRGAYTIGKVWLGEDAKGRKYVDINLHGDGVQGNYRQYLQPMSDGENAHKGWMRSFDSVCQALGFDNRSLPLQVAVRDFARVAPSYKGNLVEVNVKVDPSKPYPNIYINKTLRGVEHLQESFGAVDLDTGEVSDDFGDEVFG